MISGDELDELIFETMEILLNLGRILAVVAMLVGIGMSPFLKSLGDLGPNIMSGGAACYLVCTFFVMLINRTKAKPERN